MHISDLARRWIIANFVIMIATAAAELLNFGIRHALGLDSANALLSAKVTYVIAQTILTLATFVIYAKLTGDVLRVVVPAFPRRSWLAIHLVMGLVVGAGASAAGVSPSDSEPIDWTDTAVIVLMFVLVAVGGAVLGAIVGGLQALILRRAAYGARAWIAYSALATGLMLLISIGVLSFLPLEQTFVAEAARQASTIVAGVIWALIMLPALRRLRPRIEGGH